MEPLACLGLALHALALVRMREPQNIDVGLPTVPWRLHDRRRCQALVVTGGGCYGKSALVGGLAPHTAAPELGLVTPVQPRQHSSSQSLPDAHQLVKRARWR